MPLFEVELDDGRKFEVEAESAPNQREILDYLGEAYAEDTGQSPIATFGSGLARGAASAFTAIPGGIGAVQGLFQEEKPWLSTMAEQAQGAVEEAFPVNPANPKAAGFGSAVGQVSALLGGTLAGGAAGLGAKLLGRSAIGANGLAGFQQGEQAAEESGIDSFGGRAAMVGGFGLAEAATELLGGGFGTTKYAKSLLKDLPGILKTGVPEGALVRGAKTAVREAAEEPATGAAQSALEFSLQEEDPNRPGFTPTGKEIVVPMSGEFFGDRAEEAMYGLAGGAVFGGVQALRNPNVAEVLDWRAATAEKRKTDTVLPEEAEEVDLMDRRASEFLTKQGISPEQQTSFINSKLKVEDPATNKILAAADGAEAVGAPRTREALLDILEETEDLDTEENILAAEVRAADEVPAEVAPAQVPVEEPAPVAVAEEVPVVADPLAKPLPVETVEAPPALTEEPEPAPLATVEAPVAEPPPPDEIPTPSIEPVPPPQEAPAAVAEAPPPQETVTYAPEPVPEGALVEKKYKASGEVTKIKYPKITVPGQPPRAYFTNEVKPTYAQIAAGEEVRVPLNAPVRPEIDTEIGEDGVRRVTGVRVPINGRPFLVKDRATAAEAYSKDKKAVLRAERAATAIGIREARAAAKSTIAAELPESPDERVFIEGTLAADSTTRNGGMVNEINRWLDGVEETRPLDPVARANALSAILDKQLLLKRVQHFIDTKHGGDKNAAAASVKNPILKRRIAKFSPSQVGNLAYSMPEIREALRATAKAPSTSDIEDAPAAAVIASIDDAPPVEAQNKLDSILVGLPDILVSAAKTNADYTERFINAHAQLAAKLDLPADTTESLLSLVKRQQGKDSSGLNHDARKLIESLRKLDLAQPLNKPTDGTVAARMEEASRLGLVDGDPASVLTALERIEADSTGMFYHPHLRMVAKFMRKLPVNQLKGLRFDLDDPMRAGSFNVLEQAVRFNMTNNWGTDLSIGQVLIHELGHFLTFYKVNVPQTEADRALAVEIESLRSEIEEYTRNVRPEELEKANISYGLSSTDEFITAVFNDPRFVEYLSSLPTNLVRGQEATAKDNMFVRVLRKLWNAMLGRSVNPGSPLERAMNAIFNLAETPWTIPTQENILRWYMDPGSAAPQDTRFYPEEQPPSDLDLEFDKVLYADGSAQASWEEIALDALESEQNYMESIGTALSKLAPPDYIPRFLRGSQMEAFQDQIDSLKAGIVLGEDISAELRDLLIRLGYRAVAYTDGNPDLQENQDNPVSWVDLGSDGRSSLGAPAFLESLRSTEGVNRYDRTSVPLFEKKDPVTGYKASGFILGAGRKNAFIAEAQRKYDALKTKADIEERIITRDLRSAGNKDYGAKNIPWDVIATTMGNNDNVLDPGTDIQFRKERTAALRAGLGVLQSARAKATTPAELKTAQDAWNLEKDRIEQEYVAKREAAAKDFYDRVRAEQQAALDSLLPDTRQAVVEARDKLNGLQEELIRSGFLSGKLMPIVEKSKGLYLHRSYALHNDPSWGKWVLGTDPKAVTIRNKVANLIREDLIASKARELRRETPGLDKTDALNQAAGLVDPREVQARIEELIALPDQELSSFLQGGSLGGKPSSILKHRGDLHPVLQEFFGKYEDPLINATKTYGLIQGYLGVQRMLRSIVEDSRNNGYLFAKQSDADGLVPVVADSDGNRKKYPALFQTKVVDGVPMAGEPWYGPPMLRDALADLAPKTTDLSGWGRWIEAFRTATGFAMAAQTVYSVAATARDFQSNMTLMLMNGHLPFTPGGVSWDSFKSGIAANIRESGIDKVLEWAARPVRGRKAPPLMDHKKWDKIVGRLVELRVMSDNTVNGTINELVSGSGKRYDMRGEPVNKALRLLHSGVSWVDQRAQAFRALSDNVPKIWIFLSELDRVKKFHPEYSETEAEEAAAAKVRATTPTYSQGSDLIKALRRQPLIAPFISFVGETLRIPAQTIKLAAQEMRASHPGEKAIGTIRMAGVLTTLTVLPALLSAAVRALRDEEDDEIDTARVPEALSRFVPAWQQKNQLMWLNRDGNKHRYMDISYLLPLDLPASVLATGWREMVTDPENATLLEKTAGAMEGVFEQATKPIKEQLLLGAIGQVLYNRRSSEGDQPLYNEELDSWAKKAGISLQHILGVFKPGTIKTAERIYKGTQGEVDAGGRVYELGVEARAALGIKAMTMDLETKLMRLGNQRKQVLGEAMQFASLPFTSSGTQDDDELIDAVVRMNDGRRDTLAELRKDYLAALTLGMDQATAVRSLKQSSVTDDELGMVLRNQYQRKGLSEEALRKSLAEGAKLGQDRLGIYRRALESYPSLQPLTKE